MSAISSLVFLLGIALTVVFIFINWFYSIGAVVLAVVSAPLSRIFDTWGNSALYGKEAGKTVSEVDWEHGRSLTQEQRDRLAEQDENSR